MTQGLASTVGIPAPSLEIFKETTPVYKMLLALPSEKPETEARLPT